MPYSHLTSVLHQIQSIWLTRINNCKVVWTYELLAGFFYRLIHWPALVQRCTYKQRYYLRICLTNRRYVVICLQLILQYFIVLNYSIMHQCYSLKMICMRMRIDVSLFAMCCPSCMSYANRMFMFTLSFSNKTF